MKNLFYFALITFAAIFAVSCSSDDNKSNAKEWSVEFYVSYNKYDRTNKLNLFIAGGGKATVEWGDGRQFNNIDLNSLSLSDGEMQLNVSGGNELDYYYNEEGVYKVKVYGEGHLSAFGVEFVSVEPENTVSNLDAKDIEDITFLSLYNVKSVLYSIDKCKELKYLKYEHSGLKSLDVLYFPNLIQLNCAANELKSLSLQKNTILRYLQCYSNELTSLNLMNCGNIRYVSCMYNEIPSAEMTQLYYDLPTIKQGNAYLEVDKKNAGNITIAKDKGWSVREF